MVMSVNQKMTAIADEIRDKTGGTNPLTLDDMATEVPKVFEAGKNTERISWWDKYTDNGTRDYYRYAFSNFMWTDETFNPPKPLVPKDIHYMFQNSNITVIDETKVDFSKVTSYYRDVFAGMKKLVTLKIHCGNINGFYINNFQNCTALENLTVTGTIKHNNFNVQWSTKLTHDSLMSIINTLGDKSKDTSGTVWEVTLGETNIAKLTDAEQEIVQKKGWTIS